MASYDLLIVMWPHVISFDSHVTSVMLISRYHAMLSPGNELTRVEGLEGLRDLTELVLDRNKIKVSHPESTVTNILHTYILFQLPSTEFARRLFIFTVQIEGTPLGGEQVLCCICS